jgi:hypothetical protein
MSLFLSSVELSSDPATNDRTNFDEDWSPFVDRDGAIHRQARFISFKTITVVMSQLVQEASLMKTTCDVKSSFKMLFISPFPDSETLYTSLTIIIDHQSNWFVVLIAELNRHIVNKRRSS